MTAKALARFEAKYEPEPTSGCWLWIGATSGGYGHFGRGKAVLAHRLSYEHWRGPIPAGLELDHQCRVLSCVNPSHLEATDHRTNCLRGVGVSAQNVVKTICPRGHPYDYIRPNGGRMCRLCAGERWTQRYRSDSEFRRRDLDRKRRIIVPTPELRKRLPKQQSFNDRFVEEINTQEKNLILGPLGASASAVHPTGEGTNPIGKRPRKMLSLDWIGNLRSHRREERPRE